MKKIPILLSFCFLLSGCAQHAVKKGMNKEDVLAHLGSPMKVETSKNSCCWQKGQEAWLYHKTAYRPKQKRKAVFFKDEIVSDVRP